MSPESARKQHSSQKNSTHQCRRGRFMLIISGENSSLWEAFTATVPIIRHLGEMSPSGCARRPLADGRNPRSLPKPLRWRRKPPSHGWPLGTFDNGTALTRLWNTGMGYLGPSANAGSRLPPWRGLDRRPPPGIDANPRVPSGGRIRFRHSPCPLQMAGSHLTVRHTVRVPSR